MKNSNTITDINKAAIEHNNKLFAEVMEETGATYDEAYMMAELDCTLEEAQQYIKQDAEFERLKGNILPGLIDYFNGAVEQAKELASDLANMFVFEWEQCED